MRVAWCSNCRTSVDEAHALASRLCPVCSSTNYIVVEVEDNSDDAIQSYYTNLAEGLMEAVRGLGVPVLLCAHESHTLSLADRVIPLEGPPLRRWEGEGP